MKNFIFLVLVGVVVVSSGCVAYPARDGEPAQFRMIVPVVANYSRSTTYVRNSGPPGGTYVPVAPARPQYLTCPHCRSTYRAGTRHQCRVRHKFYGDNPPPHIDTRYEAPRYQPQPEPQRPPTTVVHHHHY